MNSGQVVLCTCPDEPVAAAIGESLVSEGLAACVNLVPSLTSIYRWQGKIERADEVLLIIKTTRDGYAALEKSLQALHPYDVPEIIALSVERGLPAYLDWIETCVTEPSSG
ncbi:MAG: divalent-cation tolerance protein CutA [Pseudomonadota bacterium]